MTDTLIIPFWSSCPSPDLRLLGVEFEDRIVLQFRKSGFKKSCFSPDPDEIEQLPEQFLVLLIFAFRRGMETAEYAGTGERCPDNGQGN